MTVVIPPSYGEATVNYISANSGLRYQNVWGYKFTTVGDYDTGDLDDLAAAIGVFIQENLNGTSDVVDVVFRTDIGAAAPLEHTTPLGLLGSQGGSPLLTPQVMKLFAKRTGVAARWARGRTFVPEVVEADVDGSGLIEATPLAALQSLADDLLAAFEVGALDGMFVLHDETSPALGPNQVTSYTAEPKVATLRTRYKR